VLGGALASVAALRLPRLARASDTVRVAVVGCNGAGARHAHELAGLAGVQLAALCDVDEHVLARETRKLRERGLEVGAQSDARRLLERSDVDALVIATPDHWHALLAMWACQAGKDVYLETPVSHAYSEGAPLVTAARRHARVVASHMPGRVSPAFAAGLDWLRAGNLGALKLARVLHYVARPSIGATRGNRRIPDIVDYDLWCGPAPLLPLRRAQLHHDWRFSFAYGEGELAAGALQALDVARWALGAEGSPASVLTVGARLGYQDDGETPNTALVHLDFQPVPILLELRGLPASREAQGGDWSAAMDDYLGVRAGVVLHCAHGTLRMHGDALALACDEDGQEIRRFEGAGAPLAAWVEAVRVRQPATLAAGIEAGARTSGLVHLANASYRLGKRLGKEALLAEFERQDLLSGSVRRLLAHLEQNGVDTVKAGVVLGARLALDPESGRVRDDARAEALLAARYREPFVLPAG
jgi:predicted dehydrogenase